MTLFTVMLRLARAVAETFESTATGGSATTLVDTANVEANDYWNAGTVFFKEGPRVSTTAVPTDWAQSTHTLTIPTGTAITTASKYLLLHPKWPRSMLVQAVNDALGRQLITAEDATLATSSTATEYDLPTGVSDVLRVEYGDATNGWTRNNTWKEEGTHLRFYANAPGTGNIRLTYRLHHADVSADADAINAQINLDLLHYDALCSLFGKRYQTSNDAADKKASDEAHVLAEQERNRRPRPMPDPRYSGF